MNSCISDRKDTRITPSIRTRNEGKTIFPVARVSEINKVNLPKMINLVLITGVEKYYGEKIMFDVESDSLIMMGVAFITYLFMAIIFTFVFHYPIDLILGVFQSATVSGATTYLNEFIPYYRTALIIAFALFVGTPVVWFIMKIFSREPALYQNKRRYLE